jgi:hypothetical protein
VPLTKALVSWSSARLNGAVSLSPSSTSITFAHVCTVFSARRPWISLDLARLRAALQRLAQAACGRRCWHRCSGRPQQTSNWGSHHLFAHACTCLVQQLPQMIAYSQFLALIWLCACEFLDALSSKRAYFRAPAAISLALVAKRQSRHTTPTNAHIAIRHDLVFRSRVILGTWTGWVKFCRLCREHARPSQNDKWRSPSSLVIRKK